MTTDPTIKYLICYNPEPFRSNGRHCLGEADFFEDAVHGANQSALIWGATWVEEMTGKRRKVVHKVPSLRELGATGSKAEIRWKP
jgi:hypothetical protein